MRSPRPRSGRVRSGAEILRERSGSVGSYRPPPGYEILPQEPWIHEIGAMAGNNSASTVKKLNERFCGKIECTEKSESSDLSSKTFLADPSVSGGAGERSQGGRIMRFPEPLPLRETLAPPPVREITASVGTTAGSVLTAPSPGITEEYSEEERFLRAHGRKFFSYHMGIRGLPQVRVPPPRFHPTISCAEQETREIDTDLF